MVLLIMLVIALIVYENTFKSIDDPNIRQKHNLIYGIILVILCIRTVM